jgi:glycerate kinase
LENEVAQVAALLGHAAGRPGLETTPGAGAAGGIAFGLLTAAQAQLVPGFDLVEAWLGIDAKLAQADLVITGEGCFDDSSLEGKGPGSLLRRAQDQGTPTWVLAGAVQLNQEPPTGAQVAAITPPGMALAEALRTAPANLATSLRRRLSG